VLSNGASRLAGLAAPGIPAIVLLLLFAGRTAALDSIDAAVEPQLKIRVDSSSIVVAGVVSSAAHEAILQDAARRPDSSVDVYFDLQEASLMPPGWALITELALRLALLTRFSETTVSDSGVVMQGITADAVAWNRERARLEAALLPGMGIETRVVEVLPSPDFAELCRLQFKAILKNRSLTFAVASGDIEGNGHPLLDSLIEAAADCPSAVIGIQASGDGPASVAANRSLAEARAASIIEYMTTRGLPSERLHVIPAADTTGNRIRQAIITVSFSPAPDGARLSGNQNP